MGRCGDGAARRCALIGARDHRVLNREDAEAAQDLRLRAGRGATFDTIQVTGYCSHRMDDSEVTMPTAVATMVTDRDTNTVTDPGTVALQPVRGE